jgi:hypothetical protein
MLKAPDAQLFDKDGKLFGRLRRFLLLRRFLGKQTAGEEQGYRQHERQSGSHGWVSENAVLLGRLPTLK